MKNNTKNQLDNLVNRTDNIIFNAKTILSFFPDTITIDANKVNIILKTFFASETVTSILLKEITDVRVETALFFGKLLIDYGPHPLRVTTVSVPKLRKEDALRAKEIIEGMLVLRRSENINTTNVEPESIIEEVKEIGKV